MAISKDQPLRPYVQALGVALDAIADEIDGGEVISAAAVQSFDTVAEMQAATNLDDGMTCHTNGFHSVGDGGAAYYIVSTSGATNGMDVLECANGLCATLVIGSKLYVEQLGIQTGSDATGNSVILERALSLSTNICFMNKVYWFDTNTSVTIPSDVTIDGDGCSLRFPNSDPALVLGGSNIKIKNVRVYGNSTSKNTTLFRFYYSANNAVRNIIFEEVKCYFASVAFSLERTWILEFRKCGCADVRTCFTASGACNAITIDGGNYEYNIVSFFIGDLTATIGGLNVKNCCIEGLSDVVFSFSNTSSRNHVNVSDCYFENNQVGTNGKYPLYESASDKDVLSIRDCVSGYSPIVSSGYVNIDNTDAIAKVTGPCVLKLCDDEASLGYVNILSSPIFSKYTEVVDFLEDDITCLNQGIIYGSSLHPNLLFMIRDSSNAFISNRTIDFGTEELMDVLCLIRSSKSTYVPYAVDVEFTGDTPQALGRVGVVYNRTGSTTPTWPNSLKTAYPYFDTIKRQQFTPISSTASGGNQSGYKYDVKCQYAPNSAAPFKLLKFAVAY